MWAGDHHLHCPSLLGVWSSSSQSPCVQSCVLPASDVSDCDELVCVTQETHLRKQQNTDRDSITITSDTMLQRMHIIACTHRAS